MIIKDFIGDGILGENSFLIKDEDTGLTAIIDPSFANGYSYDEKIDYILLTHGHFDHVYSVQELRDKFGSKVVCNENEVELLKDPDLNASLQFGHDVSVVPDITLKDEEIFQLGSLKIKALHTPGHTIGGCCYIVENHIFTGDTVFKDTVGRTDLPTGSYAQILKSIKKLKTLDKDYILHCGHGEDTSLEREKEYNAFFCK